MNKIKFSFFCLSVSILLSTTGCKKKETNPVSPEDNVQNSLIRQPTPSFSSTYIDYNGMCATIRIDMKSPVPDIPAVETNTAIASMDLQGGVDA